MGKLRQLIKFFFFFCDCAHLLSLYGKEPPGLSVKHILLS